MVLDIEEADASARSEDLAGHRADPLRIARSHTGEIDDRDTCHRLPPVIELREPIGCLPQSNMAAPRSR
jgi:hypothetical protein